MKKKIINSELCSFFLSLSSLRRLDSILDLLNLLLNGRQDGVLLRSLVHENSGDLDGADNAEEEVYGSQTILGWVKHPALVIVIIHVQNVRTSPRP